MMGKLLGPLESKVMDYLWRRTEPITISAIHSYVSQKEPLAYTTVSTIVTRLVAKGLLRRGKTGQGMVYSAKLTREQFIREKSRGLIKSLLGNFGQVAIAGFVEEIKGDPESLKILRELSRD